MFSVSQVLPVVRQNEARLASADWGLYFHGTARPFSRFDDARIGTGGDLNSSLGHFLTASPKAAADYAAQAGGPQGMVLLVLMPESNPYEFSSFEDFFGTDFAPNCIAQARAHFVRTRKELQTLGHDSAFFTLDDDGLIAVAPTGRNLHILACLSIEQALALADKKAFAEGYQPAWSKHKAKVLKHALKFLAAQDDLLMAA